MLVGYQGHLEVRNWLFLVQYNAFQTLEQFFWVKISYKHTVMSWNNCLWVQTLLILHLKMRCFGTLQVKSSRKITEIPYHYDPQIITKETLIIRRRYCQSQNQPLTPDIIEVASKHCHTWPGGCGPCQCWRYTWGIVPQWRTYICISLNITTLLTNMNITTIKQHQLW